MKFDRIIMNPPWGSTTNVGIGRKILKEAFKHVTSDNNSTIVCLYGENEIFRVQSMNRKQEYEYCEEVETNRSSDFFDVGARINFVISKFTPNVKHDKMKCTFHHDSAWNGNYSVNEIFCQMKLPKDFVDLFKTTETVYNNLMDKSLKMGICNESNDQFEYFENKAKNESHKNSAVKDSKFKLIINRTSYENRTDPYFDYVENMGGCTWTCKNERIRNNMLYWLSECPLSYVWKKYFLNDTAACFAYSCLPAVDFDKDETEFKDWCDKLVPGFNSKYSVDDIVKMRYR